MKNITILICCFFLPYSSYCQNNHVFTGGELLNEGIIDLSVNKNISWSSDRTSRPGYFGVREYANFLGYSDSVNINGYVKKYGNSSFKFPVGNGKDLRTLEISNLNTESDTYAVAWIDGDPSDSLDPTEPFAGKHPINSVSGPIIQVTNIGQWDWLVGESENLGNGTTGNGNGVIITLSIPDLRNFGLKDELRIVGWNGFEWVDLSGKATATGNSENDKITGTMSAGISSITIGKVSINNPNNNEPDHFLLYPNPVINYNNINMRFKVFYSGTGTLYIYDATGRQIIRKYIEYKTGINHLPIDVKYFANGTYYINLFGQNGEKIVAGKRFIKQ